METTYIIYKVKNKEDGKVFIGRTKMTLEQVKKDHWQMYNYKVRDGEALSKLYQAFKAHQWDNFTWSVEATTANLEEAKRLWKEHVDVNDAYNGYNHWNGFKDGHKQPDEFKSYMSRIMMGRNAMEHSSNAKLTEEEVAYIRYIYNTHSSITQSALAKEYNVTSATINQIVNNKTWQYI